MRNEKRIANEDLEVRYGKTGLMHVFYKPGALYSRPNNQSICGRQRYDNTEPNHNEPSEIVRKKGVTIGWWVCCYCLFQMGRYIKTVLQEESNAKKTDSGVPDP